MTDIFIKRKEVYFNIERQVQKTFLIIAAVIKYTVVHTGSITWTEKADDADPSLTATGVTCLSFAHAARGTLATAGWAA